MRRNTQFLFNYTSQTKLFEREGDQIKHMPLTNVMMAHSAVKRAEVKRLRTNR